MEQRGQIMAREEGGAESDGEHQRAKVKLHISEQELYAEKEKGVDDDWWDEVPDLGDEPGMYIYIYIYIIYIMQTYA